MRFQKKMFLPNFAMKMMDIAKLYILKGLLYIAKLYDIQNTETEHIRNYWNQNNSISKGFIRSKYSHFAVASLRSLPEGTKF